jgi:hypothetical protein
MKKVKYYYNTHTLRYEKLITPLRVKLLRVFAFLATAFVTAAIITYFAFRFIGSPYEKQLRAENDELEYALQKLNDQVKAISQQMATLEKRDNDVYRSIFEAQPIPDSIRALEAEKAKEIAKVEGLSEGRLIFAIDTTIRKLKARIEVQKKSYKPGGEQRIPVGSHTSYSTGKQPGPEPYSLWLRLPDRPCLQNYKAACRTRFCRPSRHAYLRHGRWHGKGIWFQRWGVW